MKHINLGIALFAFIIGSITLFFNGELGKGCAWIGMSLFNLIMYTIFYFSERIDELKRK